MSTDSLAPGGAEPQPTTGSDSLSFPGALGWTALGTLVPGLGLWRAGRRVAGGVIMGAFVLAIAGLGGLYLFNRRLLEGLALNPAVLQGLAIGLVVAALLWVVVIGASYLSLRPPNPSAGQRVAGSVVVGALSFLVAAPLALGANVAWTTADLVGTIFGGDSTSDSTQPKLNHDDPWKDKSRITFLIIGGDSGNNRPGSEGDRPDTVMVATIDTHTGATTLFSLPRNAERMPFPPNSPLHKYYPNGFTSGSTELYTRSQYLLNAMYRMVPMKVPHNVLGKTKDFGASVMKVSVGYALGLPIDYFVKVNMDGFKDFINAIGGITVNVNYKVPIGGQTDAHIPPKGYLKPGPNQHLAGGLALWYARGRYGLDDYSRMERQRCVINAVVQQTTPTAVLTNFQSIAAAGKKTITTDVPGDLLPDLVDLGMKVKNTPLRSVLFDPQNGFNSVNPNWVAVRAEVQKALKATAAGAAAATSSASASPKASNSSAKHSSKDTSDDLTASCGYHPKKS